jgi:hypothetical protein
MLTAAAADHKHFHANKPRRFNDLGGHSGRDGRTLTDGRLFTGNSAALPVIA